MTDAKHTSGPWSLETVRTSSGICHKIGPFPWKTGKENHACIYVDYASEGGSLERELEANARLIAAAPDMLDALQMVLSKMSDWNQDGETIRQIKVAISKAQPSGDAKE